MFGTYSQYTIYSYLNVILIILCVTSEETAKTTMHVDEDMVAHCSCYVVHFWDQYPPRLHALFADDVNFLGCARPSVEWRTCWFDIVIKSWIKPQAGVVALQEARLLFSCCLIISFWRQVVPEFSVVNPQVPLTASLQRFNESSCSDVNLAPCAREINDKYSAFQLKCHFSSGCWLLTSCLWAANDLTDWHCP